MQATMRAASARMAGGASHEEGATQPLHDVDGVDDDEHLRPWPQGEEVLVGDRECGALQGEPVRRAWPHQRALREGGRPAGPGPGGGQGGVGGPLLAVVFSLRRFFLRRLRSDAVAWMREGRRGLVTESLGKRLLSGERGRARLTQREGEGGERGAQRRFSV